MAQERYLPTPEEIRAECIKIRDGWTEDRWKRAEVRVEWELPLAKGITSPRDKAGGDE